MKRNWWFAIAAILAVTYTGFFLSLNNLPFTDAPNHMARAVVMKSLWFDAQSPFRGMYSVRPVFMPYILPDLLLVGFLRLGFVSQVWPAITMLAMAGGFVFYAWQMLRTWWARTAAIFLAWYFATNYLLIMGFFAFEWGVAAALVALGALEAGWMALYVVACVVCYGSHLASFLTLAALVGSFRTFRAWRKEETWTQFALELAPFAVLLGYQLLFVPAEPLGGGWIHNTVWDKFGHLLEALFVRQNYVVDRSILALFFAIIGGSLWFGRKYLRREWELALMCGVVLAIYFVLPFGIGNIFYVDERALPFLYVPLIVLALRVLEISRPTLLLSACAVLAIANFASLASFLPKQNREIGEYREALQSIPAGRLVMSVETRKKDGNTWPMRHVGSFYTTDREGYSPYLFNSRVPGGPSGYFEDLTSIYRPPPNWYIDRLPVDWKQMTYDYLVVTKPFDPSRIPWSSVVYENSAATVLRRLPQADVNDR